MKKLPYILIPLIFLGVFVYRAYASSVGPSNASTAANVLINGKASGAGGGDAWVNINNSKVVDSVFADSAVCSTCDEFTELAQLTGFGFSVPVNATINGIVVTITRKQDGGGTGNVVDNYLYLDYSNATSSASKADTVTAWPTTSTAKSYGSASDLWGGTWTPAKINDSTFGVAFSATGWYNGLFDTSNAHLDGITITVYYTVANTQQVQIRSGTMNIRSGQLIIK